MTDSSVFSVRLEARLKDQVDTLARAVDRPRSWVVTRAIEEYVGREAWQIAEIEKGLKEADSGDFASAEEAAQTLAKWADAD